MKITQDILESNLKCRYKAHLKLAGEQGVRSDYELLLRESRDRVRLAAATKLLDRQKSNEVLRSFVLTRAVLKQGLHLLLDATLEDDDLSIGVDALLRVAGPSSLGNFHYIPVLFHETEKPGKEHRALLELLGLMLGPIQGRRPAWGTLIHGWGCHTRRIKLGSGVKQARRILQEIREIQGTGTPLRLILNSHCQVCEFRQRCHAEATTKDDLTISEASSSLTFTLLTIRSSANSKSA